MSKTTQEFFEHLMSVMPADADRKTLEEAISTWRTIREKRLELERLGRAAKEFETGFKDWVIETLKVQKHEGIVIGGRITALSEHDVATVSDKEEFLNYIRTTGELDLLQFRLAVGAVDERKKNDVVVPGTAYITTYDLSDKKA